MKITVLGSGTSTGVPMIGCSCEVCTSTDPKDKRLRSSILIEKDGMQLLIDTGPDLRQQFLTNHITNIDAVLYTHAHYDHVAGLDDLRPITLHSKQDIPIFANAETLQGIQQMFAHVFSTPKQIGGGITKIKATIIEKKPFLFNNIEIIPIPIKHGELDILGYRIDDFAYITDASSIPEESFDLLAGVDVLIINALRYQQHPTHLSIEQAIASAQNIGASKNYFTHIKNRYPSNTIIEFGYNNTLSHKIYAAADYFLIPSRYEPCGLTQMYAMSYGAIPIVRLTGGLADTVEEYNAENGTGEGFRFWRYNSQELTYAMSRALAIYKNQPHWDTIRQNAMNKRFTAELSAQKYLEVFAWALEK